MARRDQNETETTTEAQTDGTEATTTEATEPKTDDRYKMVTHPQTGESVKRKDYIVELWESKKYTRGAIAKHLTEITGKNVPYQIVFQATKGVAGGPDKAAETVPAADGSAASE